MRRGRLHVMGASGAGTTTLGRAVADHWSVPHADADDYFWLPTDPPYAEKRPDADRLDLMQRVFLPREAWVLSGSMLGWGESVVGLCDAVVFLSLDPEERLRRIEAREVHRLAGRGADEAAWQAFLVWARSYDDRRSPAGAGSPTRPGSPPSTCRCCASTAQRRVRSSATRCCPGSRPADPRGQCS